MQSCKASTSFGTRLLRGNKCIELRQPALTEDLFRESLRTLARAEAHRESICWWEFESLREAFRELLFGGSVEACGGNVC